ncbi:MAG TPA: hypothetical protein VFB38_18640 [Chthonomonadaceae bacterium]|nr:hypothetical protein [Chthonomonadaceae bacterium]
MPVLLCEVIGCGRPAAYVRVAAGSGHMEDYLCARCYRELQARFPDRIGFYAPLTDAAAGPLPDEAKPAPEETQDREAPSEEAEQ